VSVYLAIFVASGFLLRQYAQWAALLSVTVATVLVIIVWEQRRFNIGFIVPVRVAIREGLAGAAFAILLILACDVLVLLFSNLRQSRAAGFSVRDLIAVFIPAALHEELAFRGYVYQKLREWSRGVAITISSIVFALLHGGNNGASVLAIVNIVVAGVMLALAYERYRRLWFPIGIHFAWNLLSGPILGFPVSGFVARSTLFRVTGSGPALVTGGSFGIEASVCMTVLEILGIIWLLKNVRVAKEPR
jgi:membrane protease YdiL (CAAX protease family)